MKNVITTDLERCRELLRQDQPVAIPTETVYGLAANIYSESAVKKIFEIKGRPRFNPLIVHVHGIDQMTSLTKELPRNAVKLAEQFWPGPLTLILPKQDSVSDLITAGKETVGIRMPNHELTLRLLKGLNFPLAAPSANPFTRVSPTSAQHVADYFGDAVTVLDGGPCTVGLESTIVGFEGETPVVYRKGGITIEAIEQCVGPVKLRLENEKAPEAPGMLFKHYSPRTTLVLTNDVEKALSKIDNQKVGVLSFYKDAYPGATIVKALSKTRDLEEAAQKLFDALHELDTAGLDMIIAERLPEEGLGITINDRLERAKN
ncbi:L-threonylcarbamoyladenylate synthase [Allomuricauda sp. SCSIO 65647]|uniref:L-threonylcarbamoyladenylate synthase n=1 Tax=Allomuricauda sp. SCSIO 65647 TaxID=2908843 RepID=UPI001F2C7A7D|nr:L-threonylcarbamoyladenylate synthase [Muricauda sp. SCSIO 65647]UJH68715.1 threonylcarbamoyl-AMP synthase [Muricauda sp. SCSIO 65647]